VTTYPDLAYKILSHADWQRTVAEGHYEGSPVDQADGYIHLSTEAQLPGTAAKHYIGKDSLILVEVRLSGLGDDLVWEPSRGGDLFPHIYGPLPLKATGRAWSLCVTDAGRMILGDTAPAQPGGLFP